MTGPELRAWRKRLNLTQAGAAIELDISESRIRDYEAGITRGQGTPAPIPRVVELACEALEKRAAGARRVPVGSGKRVVG